MHLFQLLDKEPTKEECVYRHDIKWWLACSAIVSFIMFVLFYSFNTFVTVFDLHLFTILFIATLEGKIYLGPDWVRLFVLPVLLAIIVHVVFRDVLQ